MMIVTIRCKRSDDGLYTEEEVQVPSNLLEEDHPASDHQRAERVVNQAFVRAYARAVRLPSDGVTPDGARPVATVTPSSTAPERRFPWLRRHNGRHRASSPRMNASASSTPD